MLELLQKTLLYIEEQNEWLSYIQSTIQEKEQHYKSLHSIITKEILNQTRGQDVVDADDVTMEQDEIVVKEESCDVTDIVVNTILNFQETSEVTSNVDDENNSDVAFIKEEHYDVTEEDNEHGNDGGIDISSFISTNHQAVVTYGESDILNAIKYNNVLDKKSEVVDEVSENYPIIEQSKHKHTGEKPYDCPYCEKSFTQKCNRNRHLRIHTGEKPYNCHYCDKSFRSIGNRTLHLRTHTGEKPYKCEYCEKSFSVIQNRNRHLRVHKKN